MDFPKGEEAGWHVLIGDNGTGKTSILRAIAACLIGPKDILRLDPRWEEWMTAGASSSSMSILVKKNDDDKRSSRGGGKGGIDDTKEINGELTLSINEEEEIVLDHKPKRGKYSPDKYFWGTGDGWFSCGFGAFRRFQGGQHQLEQHYLRNPTIGAHLTVFHGAVALTETTTWLKDIYTRSLEGDSAGKRTLKGVQHFINKAGLLPIGYRLKEVTADGPFFEAPTNPRIHLYELSEGIKSIMSLAFELIRLILKKYRSKMVFSQLEDDNPDNDYIPIEGVVLIDEIDAHLHPTWQTRIGQWFTSNFPKLQFIVTTHSPLICHGCLDKEGNINGSIWQLSSSEDDSPSQKLNQTKLYRLVYGNVLDAYGTEAFGQQVERSPQSLILLKEYAKLDKLFTYGQITEVQNQRRKQLQQIFTTDAITDF